MIVFTSCNRDNKISAEDELCINDDLIDETCTKNWLIRNPATIYASIEKKGSERHHSRH